MISNTELEAACKRACDPVSAGCSVDHVLKRQAGLVSRTRDYRVYLPAGYDGTRSMPVVFVMHGCQQTHLDIQSISAFDSIADREHFIVVYPFVTSHADLRTQHCWGWWLAKERKRDAGEVGDIQQIVRAVISDYAVDQSRLHIVGLSAGAAMSVVALTTYSDIWNSGASVAGVPFGESAQAVKFARHIPVHYKPLESLISKLEKALVSQAPPLLIIQSDSDSRVGVQLAENLQNSWRHVSSLLQQADQVFSGSTSSMDWVFHQFLDGQGCAGIAHLSMKGAFHGWIGGLPGNYSLVEGPNISELIWAFFNQPSKS